MQMLRDWLAAVPLWDTLSRRRKVKRLARRYWAWKREGGDLPMPHYGKQLVLLDYARRFGLRVLVETGTYTGHTVTAMLDRFDEVYSIELDPELCRKAQQRFARYRHVHILEGSSEVRLPEVLEREQRPCLFWLDAHYSQGRTAKGDLETPIMIELEHILRHPLAGDHVLLIDDARCFTGEGDYPLLSSVRDRILTAHPTWTFAVEDDIIRAHRTPEAVSG